MRVWGIVLSTILAAGAASADVRMTVKQNGSKVIYNVGRASRGARGSDLAWLAKRHDRRSKYDPIIEKYAELYDVDPVLVRAVIQVESDFDHSCVSTKGARGLMQLMPATAKRFGVTDINDPEQNIRGGVRFLAYLNELFNGNLQRVFAGYNAGENAVIRYGGIPPYEETSTYVVRAMTVYHGRPYGGAISFAGGRGGRKLKGGFGAGLIEPMAAAILPGAKYLGSH
jgi:soluble lytic murein transglycosylase-like protein